MGNSFTRLRNHRLLVDALCSLFEYLVFNVLFPGTFVFRYFENSYINSFEATQRNPRPRDQIALDESKDIPDWENPLVVGRNRRPTHTPLHAFISPYESLQYWNPTYPKYLQHSSNKMFLSNSTLTLEDHAPSMWDFVLVGSPELVPHNWFLQSKVCDEDWKSIPVPSHWQLQGHDIPIYTNTMYPFAFDPPRARRTGTWRITDCDQGLYGSQCSVTNKINSKEPGPNPTGLYKRSFQIPNDWNYGTNPHRIFLVFEGVDACLSVWVNGIYIGYSQDSCLPAEFDITEALGSLDGPNHTIAAQVSRWCDGSYLEDQDKWWLSGIYREVFIYRKPLQFISDYEITYDVTLPPDPDAEQTLEEKIEEKIVGKKEARDFKISAIVNVQVQIESFISSKHESIVNNEAVVKVELWQFVERGEESRGRDIPGQSIPTPTEDSGHCKSVGGVMHGEHLKQCKLIGSEIVSCVESVSKTTALPLRGVAESICSTVGADHPLNTQLLANKLHSASVVIRVNEPMLWSAETPSLYIAVISLYGSRAEAETEAVASTTDSRALDSESCRIGIRDVRIAKKDHVLCVNGSPLVVAGVNRHEFDPRRGRTVSEAIMRKDISLLKQFNFNAVRCSHYPPHHRFLELCDEAGIFVVDEANIETHGFQTLGQPVGYLSNQPEWASAMTSRVSRMYERDKNFSCIIGWSLGNESGLGSSHEAMASWVRSRDASRFLQVICSLYTIKLLLLLLLLLT